MLYGCKESDLKLKFDFRLIIIFYPDTIFNHKNTLNEMFYKLFTVVNLVHESDNTLSIIQLW